MELKGNNIIFGNYVITRQKNAFNDKYSYWISKKNYIVCLYCFSSSDNLTINKVYNILKKDFKKYILHFENYLNESVKRNSNCEKNEKKY